MGTCYFFARLDNKTLFDMDGTYGLGAILCGPRGVGVVDLEDIKTAIEMWYADWPFKGPPPDDREALAAAILDFADGHPLVFITEYDDETLDAIVYNDGRRLSDAVTHDRHHPGYRIARIVPT